MDFLLAESRYLGSESYVTSRIDDGEVEIQKWILSTDSKATFYPGNTIDLIKAFFIAKEFIVKTTPHSENPITAHFNLIGFYQAAEKYIDYLNWQ